MQSLSFFGGIEKEELRYDKLGRGCRPHFSHYSGTSPIVLCACFTLYLLGFKRSKIQYWISLHKTPIRVKDSLVQYQKKKAIIEREFLVLQHH